jgi:hypothetical protein
MMEPGVAAAARLRSADFPCRLVFGHYATSLFWIYNENKIIVAWNIGHNNSDVGYFIHTL